MNVYDFRFAIEGHCVHYNVKYGTFEEAAKHEDGIAVVAFFLKVTVLISYKRLI